MLAVPNASLLVRCCRGGVAISCVPSFGGRAQWRRSRSAIPRDRVRVTHTLRAPTAPRRRALATSRRAVRQRGRRCRPRAVCRQSYCNRFICPSDTRFERRDERPWLQPRVNNKNYADIHSAAGHCYMAQPTTSADRVFATHSSDGTAGLAINPGLERPSAGDGTSDRILAVCIASSSSSSTPSSPTLELESLDAIPLSLDSDEHVDERAEVGDVEDADDDDAPDGWNSGKYPEPEWVSCCPGSGVFPLLEAGLAPSRLMNTPAVGLAGWACARL